MNLTKTALRLLLATLAAGATLVPATMAAAQPYDGPDDLTDDLCEPSEESCGDPDPDPCEELNPQAENDADECEPEPCDEQDAEDAEECDEPDPEPEPDPDEPDPVDPPVDARPNFTG